MMSKGILLKCSIFVLGLNFVAGILTSGPKSNVSHALKTDASLVKRTDSVDSDQSHRRDSKGGQLKGEYSELRSAYYGGDHGDGNYHHQQQQQQQQVQFQDAPSYQPYGAASAPGPSYGGGYGGPVHGGYGGYHGGNSIDGSGPPDEYIHDHDHHQHHHKKQHDVSHHHKHLALKGLLIPLVGVALLGAAAAFVTNPILLQLGVITGKRRRRDVANGVANGDDDLISKAAVLEKKLNEIALLEKYMTGIPQEEAAHQERMMFANYLSCSGIASTANSNSNSTGAANCLERLTCELHHPDSAATELERHVMGIVTSEILTNEYVPAEVKHRVKAATSLGADGGDCSTFPCYELESQQ